MADIKGMNIPAKIVPYTSSDKYPTHDEEYARGGYRSVNSVSEMNAIPTERRKEGMLVNVIGDKKYELKNNIFVDAGVTGNSNPDMNIDIRIIRNADGTSRLQFMIFENVTNGYVCLLRNKKNGKPNNINHKNAYIVRDFYFINNDNCPITRSAFARSADALLVNTWYDFPVIETSLISSINQTGKNPRIQFAGNTNANATIFSRTSGIANKVTARLRMALQYIQVDTNYLIGKKVNGVIPERIKKTGELKKINAYVRVASKSNYNRGYKFRMNIDLKKVLRTGVLDYRQRK